MLLPTPLDALNRQLRDPYFGGSGGPGPHNDALLVTTADGKMLVHMRNWTMAPERADVAQQDIYATGYSVAATFDSPSDEHYYVPTIGLRVLFVFLVIEHQRRRVIHFGVTEHPTAEWAAQQVVEAFSERDGKHYLIRDRDSIYGHEFCRRIQSLSMEDVVTAPQSPWQNAFVERLIGSIRRECLYHVVVLSQRHLRRLLKSYFAYYHCSRIHLALAKDAPDPRAIMRRGEIIAIQQVGGLHHRYERRAA